MSEIAGEVIALRQLLVTTLVALKQNGTFNDDTLVNIFEASLKKLNPSQEPLDDAMQKAVDTAKERLEEMREAIKANF